MAKRTAHDEMVAAYLSGLGLSVISISNQLDNSEISFEIAPWPGPPAKKHSNRIAVFVFGRASHAELVISECIGDPYAISSPEAASLALQFAASSVGAKWQSIEDVMLMAGPEVMNLDRRIEAWKKSGGLAPFNQGYKRYRQRCTLSLIPAVSYSTYYHWFKLKIMDLVGRNVASGKQKFAGINKLRSDVLL